MNTALKFENTNSISILAKQHQKDGAIIKTGLKSFFEVGFALMRIRENKSYKEVDGYNTFEDYYRDKWDISSEQAYRLIRAAKLIDNLSAVGEIFPETENQCRPLAWLKPQEQREVWQMVTSSGEKITSKLIEKMVLQFLLGKA